MGDRCCDHDWDRDTERDIDLDRERDWDRERERDRDRDRDRDRRRHRRDRYHANLEGAQEVPPVETDAFGEAIFNVSPDHSMMDYRLTVVDLERFTVAHIHLGRRGENGPVVAFLYGPVSPGTTRTERTITGTLDEDSLVGPLEGEPFSELVRQMALGNTYVNAHTERYPDGEIRGQIMRRNIVKNDR